MFCRRRFPRRKTALVVFLSVIGYLQTYWSIADRIYYGSKPWHGTSLRPPFRNKSQASSPGDRRHDNRPPVTRTPSLDLIDATTRGAEQQQYAREPRQAVRHIGFLKVHKAGSTTLQNLLFRFATHRNLTLVLPERGTNYFSTNPKTHRKILPPPDSGHYDILACHSMFNASVYAAVLPPESRLIAIVRDPLQLMISSAYYYRDVWGLTYLRMVPRSQFIGHLIRRPEIYDKAPFSRTRNSMALDFGFASYRRDPSTIAQYLAYLNATFSLVLVLEQFDESLVLLKRLFHWEISDILYLAGNQRRHEPVTILKSDAYYFKKRNGIDIAIYAFFKRELNRKISMAAPDFQREVSHLKSVLANVSLFCQQGNHNEPPGAALTVTSSPWNEPFTVTVNECKVMNTPELDFIELLRVRHNKMLH